jgi:hypothetical protein
VYAQITNVQQSGADVVVTVLTKANKADPTPLGYRQYTFGSDASAKQITDQITADLAAAKAAFAKAAALQAQIGTEVTV